MTQHQSAISPALSPPLTEPVLWDWLAESPGVRMIRAGDLRGLVRTRFKVLTLEVPHDHTLVLPRAELETLVSDAGLLVGTDGLPEMVVLVADPGPQARAVLPDWAIERRVLADAYHGQIHRVLEAEVAADRLDEPRSTALLARLGGAAVREAVRVLEKADRWIGEPAASAWLIEILATTLEQRATRPFLLPVWFPALVADRVDAVVAELGVDLSLATLLGPRAAARAAELSDMPPATQDVAADPPDHAALHQASALAERLHTAMGEEGPTPVVWTAALAPVFQRARVRTARHARRLLFSLERACRAAEQPGVTYDVWSWLRSLGRTPLRRSLADRVPVQLNRFLRGAHARVARLHLGGTARTALGLCLGQALDVAKKRVRAQLRVVLTAVFERTGPHPHVLPERVAREKLVEELIDRILGRDYFGFADLRDAISRNDLKLRDLERPVELVVGDPLLQADRRLASLTGVYRQSTFYMRALQRISSLGFGTRLGRILTRNVVIPLAGSFVILEGLQHLVGPLFALAGLPHPHIAHPIAILALAVWMWVIVTHERVREHVRNVFRRIGRGFKWMLVLPRRILASDTLRTVASSRPVVVARRYAIRPLVAVLLVWLALWAVEVPVPWDVRLILLAVLPASASLNTRHGRMLQARLEDTLTTAWSRFVRGVLPELFHVIMTTSRRALAFIERVAYVVDELLRIHSRENRITIVLKAVLGRIWAAFMYVVRFYATLLVEPQINPIKHFPVVTVSHKIILPALPALYQAMRAPLAAVFGDLVGNALAGATVFLLPGFFGFLVWELSANWRLYAASRPPRLMPARMGTHGWRMTGILRLGFHSGALPKWFEKRRKAVQHAWDAGRVPPAPAERGDEIAHELHDFWERELVALLRQAPGSPLELSVRAIRLDRFRCAVELGTGANGSRSARQVPLRIWIEERQERLVAQVEELGFAAELDPAHRAALADALAGVLVRAQTSAIEVAADLVELPSDVRWSDWVARWQTAAREPQLEAGRVVVRGLGSRISDC